MESKFRNIRKIVQHLRHPYRLFFYLALLGIIYMGLDIVEPVLAGHIMDALLSNEVKTEIWQLGLLWLAIFILKYAVSYEKMRIGLFSMLSGMENIQLSIFQTILSAPLAFFNQFSVGYLMARQTDDVFNLEGMMPHHLVEGLLAIAESFVILSCMFYLNVWLGIGTVLLKCLDLFSNFYFPLKELYKEHNEARAIASSELQDVLKNILLIKAAGKEKEECQRFQECLKQYYGTWNKRDEINYIRSLLTRMSEDASYMIIIVLGGVSMYYGKMTIGEITAFLLFYKKLSSAFVGTLFVLECLPEDATSWNRAELQDVPLFKRWYNHVIKKGPEWDHDKFYFNYILHPYAGATYFMAARSCGFNFWRSVLYGSIVSTVGWEFGIEAFMERPSIQDIFVTPIAGCCIGEGFYHVKRWLVDNDFQLFGSPVLGGILCFLVDPVNEFTGLWLGNPARRVAKERATSKSDMTLSVVPSLSPAYKGFTLVGYF